MKLASRSTNHHTILLTSLAQDTPQLHQDLSTIGIDPHSVSYHAIEPESHEIFACIFYCSPSTYKQSSGKSKIDIDISARFADDHGIVGSGLQDATSHPTEHKTKEHMPPQNKTRQGSTPAAPTTSTPATSAPAAKETKQEVNTGVDLSKLTPEQLVALQKQLKAKKVEISGDRKKWVEIVDVMLQEKDGTEHKHTTRDILNRLVSEKVILDTTSKGWDTKEIKHIQARKQLLEKKTDEKGALVHPEGTFGYKASAGVGFLLTANRVAEWFKSADNIAKLTDAEKSVIKSALK